MPPGIDDYSLIVSRSYVDLLEYEVPSTREILKSLDDDQLVRRFPDGSLSIEQQEGITRFRSTSSHPLPPGELKTRYVQRNFDARPTVASLCGSDGFRSIEAYPPRIFLLVFPNEYYESTMPHGFIAGPRIGMQPRIGESNLSNLALTVSFKRRPSRKTMRLFTQIVAQWLVSVEEEGVFGEGPIKAISPDVVFQNLCATFRVDASRSGQNSLNWFILKALAFGVSTSIINGVLIDSEELMENWCGPNEAEKTNLSIGDAFVAAQGPTNSVANS